VGWQAQSQQCNGIAKQQAVLQAAGACRAVGFALDGHTGTMRLQKTPEKGKQRPPKKKKDERERRCSLFTIMSRL